jgi:hypothetical protein
MSGSYKQLFGNDNYVRKYPKKKQWEKLGDVRRTSLISNLGYYLGGSNEFCHLYRSSRRIRQFGYVSRTERQRVHTHMIIRSASQNSLPWEWHMTCINFEIAGRVMWSLTLFFLVATKWGKRNLYRGFAGRTAAKFPLGNFRLRWDDNIKMDLKQIIYSRSWIGLIRLRKGISDRMLWIK